MNAACRSGEIAASFTGTRRLAGSYTSANFSPLRSSTMVVAGSFRSRSRA
jgi:hypothetical protein